MAAAAAAAAAAAGGRPAGATVGLVGGAAPCATADRAHKPARSDPAAAPRGSDRHIGVPRAPALARECQERGGVAGRGRRHRTRVFFGSAWQNQCSTNAILFRRCSGVWLARGFLVTETGGTSHGTRATGLKWWCR